MSGYRRHAAQFVGLVGLLFFVSLAQALTLNVSMNPDPVRPNEGLRATVPSSGVNTFNQSYLSGGGTCTFTEVGTSCFANERVTWNLGTIPDGQGVMFSMAMVVTNGTAAGTVITLPAEVAGRGVSNTDR